MIAIVPVVAAASKPVHRCSLIYSDSRCGRAGTAFVGEQNRGRAKPQTNRASNEVRRSHLDAAALLPCCPANTLRYSVRWGPAGRPTRSDTSWVWPVENSIPGGRALAI